MLLGGLAIHSGLRVCLTNELHVLLHKQGKLRVELDLVGNNIVRILA